MTPSHMITVWCLDEMSAHTTQHPLNILTQMERQLDI
jgi:hypothetical protein